MSALVGVILTIIGVCAAVHAYARGLSALRRQLWLGIAVVALLLGSLALAYGPAITRVWRQ